MEPRPGGAPAFDLDAAAHRAMADHGFVADFGPDVDAELATIADRYEREAALPGVRDLRALPWSSIDNRESRDLDQIEVVERSAEGVRVLVAIADVDALVVQRGALDARAATNTTSVYTATAVFPMLPEALSTDLTSLAPGQDRLAVVTELTVLPDGRTARESVYRALVRNHARLVYEDVAAWLEGHGDAPDVIHDAAHGADAFRDQIRLQAEVARTLRRVRVANGALDLETVEASPVAKDGKIVDLRVVEKSVSRELIEDFMIAANGAVARWLGAHGRSAIRRVVTKPRRWDRIVALAATHGAALPEEPHAQALAAFLEARREADPARFADLSLAMVKMMGPGEYALDRPGEERGHFGLAVGDYAHSTAPNRRFADLVTQRLVKACAAGAPPPYTDAELAAVAARCTEREHGAQKVERTMRKIGAALLLGQRLGETFDAIVTGVTPKGTFVRLLAPPAEGRVVQGEAGLDVGDELRVKLVATEPGRGFIDLVRA